MQARTQCRKDLMMTVVMEENVLRYVVDDAELEAAAEEVAMSYTYQTASSSRCCN
jgi:hypothetical protein